MLNDSGKFAFVLENEADGETFVSYPDKAPMEMGEELVKLLYGENILEKNDAPMPPEMDKMIARAEELCKKGVHWHHHMLFPDCIYNKHKGKYSIFFEDPESGEVIEYLSDNNPTSELARMEVLYYSQPNLS